MDSGPSNANDTASVPAPMPHKGCSGQGPTSPDSMPVRDGNNRPAPAEGAPHRPGRSKGRKVRLRSQPLSRLRRQPRRREAAKDCNTAPAQARQARSLNKRERWLQIRSSFSYSFFPPYVTSMLNSSLRRERLRISLLPARKICETPWSAGGFWNDGCFPFFVNDEAYGQSIF